MATSAGAGPGVASGPDETAEELLLRSDLPSLGVSEVDEARARARARLGRPFVDVLELAGAAGAGKTELAIAMAAAFVLPASLGGSDGSVVWFDSELRLSAERVASVLCSRVQVFVDEDKLDPLDAEHLVKACAQRIHVSQPGSSLAMLAALRCLRDQLHHLDKDTHPRLVVVDSLASFHFQDLETEGVEAGLHCSVPNMMRAMLVDSLVPATLLGLKPALLQPKLSGELTGEYLSQAWQGLVALRLLVETVDNHLFRLLEPGRELCRFTIDAQMGVQVQRGRG